MCGICGFFSKENITPEQLRQMNDTMYHRGPDDCGAEIYPQSGGYQVGMAQRRLSIMDLSALGHQPMHSPDRRLTVVFNGEIYNFRELKRELQGYPFCSECDTEVILAAYRRWGISCAEHFNGMFAIALYDREEEALYLIRDRIGKKPLYYFLDGENLVFASELKPIMRCPGFSQEIDKRVLSRYLFQQYINAPESIYEKVYKLEPGAILRFHNGERKLWKYWDIRQAYEQGQKNPVNDYQEAKEGLKERLKRAVAERLEADVPLGSFLSGGYDSSLMTAMAQEQSKEPVKTFSIGFHEPKYNEAGYARAVAEHLGTQHTEMYIDEKDMFSLVESIPQYYDEPFADSSEIATMMVSALAKKEVTVALSGDGGDEFFCGYNIYERVAQAQKLDFLGGMVHGLCQLPGFRQLRMQEKLPFKVRIVAANRNPECKTQLGSDNYLIKASRMAGVLPGEEPPLPIRYLTESSYPAENWQIRRMLLDMDTYLPGDILCKVDRASMKYSLEARCPILDREVMEYSFRIPHAYKYAGGDKKHILKDIAYDYIPRELLDRPKVGFGVPLDAWLRGPLREKLTDYCSTDYLRRQQVFDPEYTAGLVSEYLRTGDAGPATGANYSKLVWSFFVFQQWYEAYKKVQ